MQEPHAGNTQGWARDANIYNINFHPAGSGYGGNSWDEYLWDYVRYFHKNKPVNTSTGRRNPTIMNNSWGYSYGSLIRNVADLTKTIVILLRIEEQLTDMSSMNNKSSKNNVRIKWVSCSI